MNGTRNSNSRAARLRSGPATIALGLVVATLAIGARPCPAASFDREAAIRRLTGFVAVDYDSARGGFVTKEGAPNEGSIELAWALAGADPVWRSRARRAVTWTWSLYDSVGGGFLHDQGDARHDVASFDKHTEDNARRLENRLDAWVDSRSEAGRAGGYAEADRHAIRLIVDFFDRVLLDPRGGFVAGQVGDRSLMPADNGLAVHALMRWASLTGETRWRDFAWKTLDRLKSTAWNPEFGFLRTGEMGQVVEVPRLDDQVEMGRAYVLAAHLAGRVADLESARAIGEILINHFEDRRQGGMRWQVALRKDGTVKNSARDPEPNARAARFLVELASVTGEQRFREAAERLMQTFVPGRGKPAPDDADWVLAMRGFERAELPARGEWKEKPAEAEKERPQVIRFKKKRR